MNNELNVNDKITITTKNGDTYTAIVLGINKVELFINLIGFGKLSVEWKDIWLIQKIITPNCRGIASYSASYKIRVYQNDASTQVAS